MWACSCIILQSTQNEIKTWNVPLISSRHIWSLNLIVFWLIWLQSMRWWELREYEFNSIKKKCGFYEQNHAYKQNLLILEVSENVKLYIEQKRKLCLICGKKWQLEDSRFAYILLSYNLNELTPVPTGVSFGSCCLFLQLQPNWILPHRTLPFACEGQSWKLLKIWCFRKKRHPTENPHHDNPRIYILLVSDRVWGGLENRGFCGLALPNNVPSHPKIEIWNTINRWNFVNF